MSRNLRQKTAPAAPKKARKLATPSTDSSSDDDYNGVNDISDDEDEEPDVLAAEERAIIDTISPEGGDEDDLLTTRPVLDDEQSWEGFPLEDELPNNIFYNPREGFDAASPIDVSSRRVSFDVQSDISDSENGDINDDMFPDLFVEQDSLDPTFRRRVEADEDDAGSETYWGLSEDETFQETGVAEETSGAEDYSDDSEDDSEDDGDTTDDEDLPPTARRIVEHDASSPSPSSVEEEMTIARRTPLRARKPQLGKWVHPASTPFATVAGDGKSLLMFRKVDESELPTNNGSPSHVQTGLPTMGDSGNVMISAMLNTVPLNNLFGGLAGEVVGPSEAFFPFTSVNSDGTYTQDSSSVNDDYDEDLEVQFVDFEAAIDFSALLDDPDETVETPDADADDSEGDSPSMAEPSSTPARPRTARPTTPGSEQEVHPLLTHFNSTKVSVGAFRQNQNRHHQLTSNMVSQESLAFHNSQSPAPIRGIRSGRIPYTNTPITPARKHKKEKRAMASSPMNGGEERGHKRNRSLY